PAVPRRRTAGRFPATSPSGRTDETRARSTAPREFPQASPDALCATSCWLRPPTRRGSILRRPPRGFMNYVAVAIPFFIPAMLVESLYVRRVKRQTYRLADRVNSLQLGTLSRLVDVLRLGFSAVVFGALVQWLGIHQWAMDSSWQWVAAFVAYDFCYYWKH